MSELKPCLHCENTVIQISSDGGCQQFCAWCTSCGMQTEKYDTKAEAIAAWNRRPPAIDRETGNLLDFICYLVDTKERETVYEESLQVWLADFLKSKYNRSRPVDSMERVKCMHFEQVETCCPIGREECHDEPCMILDALSDSTGEG